MIIPLMRGDAVHAEHWMTDAQFLNAVALGQVTPGPVVATVAAVGCAAHGLAGAGPSAIGAIGGAAITLALSLSQAWQGAVLAAAVVALLMLGRGVVSPLLGAAAVGVVLALAGAPLP